MLDDTLFFARDSVPSQQGGKVGEKSLPVRAPTHGRIRSAEATDGRPEQGKSFLFCTPSFGGIGCGLKKL